MATLKVSGVSASQVDRWDAARGFESFASWARRMLDEAAAQYVPGVVGWRPDGAVLGVQAADDMSGLPPVKSLRGEPVGAGSPVGGEEADPPESPRKKERSQMCVHRVPAGTWCKRCGS